jgi:hypothetical protein
MPKFKKRKVKEKVILEPTVYTPYGTRINDGLMSAPPPTTEYENRRASIGRDAYRQVTGK